MIRHGTLKKSKTGIQKGRDNQMEGLGQALLESNSLSELNFPGTVGCIHFRLGERRHATLWKSSSKLGKGSNRKTKITPDVDLHKGRIHGRL